MNLNVKTTRPFRYDLNQIPYDYTVEVRNRFKGLDLIDRVPDELWTEVRDIVQETGIKTIPMEKKSKMGRTSRMDCSRGWSPALDNRGITTRKGCHIECECRCSTDYILLICSHLHPLPCHRVPSCWKKYKHSGGPHWRSAFCGSGYFLASRCRLCYIGFQKENWR